MAYEFISQLSESKLFPSKQSLAKLSFREIADMTLVYMCAMRILLAEEDTASWARLYCRRTIAYGNFDHWKVGGTDFYVLIHAIKAMSSVEYGWEKYSVKNALNWLRKAVEKEDANTTAHFFTNIDRELGTKDATLRSVRRLVKDWPELDLSQKKLALTKILLFMRRKAYRSEILPFLERLARRSDLELNNATDKDNPDAVRNEFIRALGEDAVAGATSCASIATVAIPMGAVQRRSPVVEKKEDE